MTHPCCYIQITDKNHPFYKKQYTNIDLDTSGTLSYSRRYLKIPDETDPSIATNDYGGWWIGWDYMRTGYHNFNIPEEETLSFIILTAVSRVSSGEIVTTDLIIISSTVVPSSYLSKIKL